jgi:hypothetical protein
LQQIIQQIIGRVPRGMYFDSHFVIDTIIKEHSDDYLRYAAQSMPAGTTPSVHSQIACIIRSFHPNLITQVGSESFSYNIHGKPSECQLWLKN